MEWSNWSAFSQKHLLNILEAVLDLVPDLVYIYNLDTGKNMFINKASVQVLGYSREDMNDMGGEVLAYIVQPEEGNKLKEHLNTLQGLAHGETTQISMNFLCKTGEIKSLHLTETPISLGAHYGKLILGHAKDLSDITQRDNQIASYQANMRALSFMTSHELRHEYAKLSSIYQMFREGVSKPSEDFIFYDNEMYASYQRMNGIISNMNKRVHFNQRHFLISNQNIPHDYERVLLVDDDSLTNTLHRRMLEKVVPEVMILDFLDIQSALEELVHSKFQYKDLILLDLNFPEASAWDFLEAFEALNVPANIWIVSSSINPEDMQQAGKYPMVTQYLTKPIGLDGLKTALFGPESP